MPGTDCGASCSLFRRHGNEQEQTKLTLDELHFDEKQMRQFADLVTKLDAAGLALHVHAIGDKAVRTSLDAFAAARKRMAIRTTVTRSRICNSSIRPTSHASRSSA